MEQLHQRLAHLASLSDAERLYRLEFDPIADGVVERWCGTDGLGEHTVTQVQVLSMQAGLALEQMLGERATLHIRLPSGATVARSGVVAEAACVGSDGGLARYHLHLQSWTGWLEHGRHSRVFQEQSVRQIVDAVLEDYAPLAAWRWAEGCDAFLNARVRSYCVQYRERDLDFIQRLLAEEGLGWRLLPDADAPCGNLLEVFADSTLLPKTAIASGLRFHRADGTEPSDTLQGLVRQRGLTSTAVTLRSDDYRQVRNITTQLPVEGGGQGRSREAYDSPGAYAFASPAEAGHFARLHAQALEAQAQRWQGHGTVRGLHAGTWCKVVDTAFEAPPELVLLQMTHAGINNLPVDVRKALEAVFDGVCGQAGQAHMGIPPSLWQQADAVGYAQQFTALPRAMVWRPLLADATGARLIPRPTAPGYQSGIVIASEGHQGHPLYADAQGRIKVKLHFQDGSGRQDSAWLRVMQRYAGADVGSQFLPRVGQEVLVGFLEGEIDRPIVLGALYHGQGEAGVPLTPGGKAGQSDTRLYAHAQDHLPSAQANLAGGHAPVWHGHAPSDAQHRNAAAQWGMRSQEWHGRGYNQLLFDDSNQQLRVQLATTQAATQLNLGHLIHNADNYRGSFRGEGFELRTDAWGAVRAEKGLWLTAYPHSPSEPAGLAVQQSTLLNQLNQLSTTFTHAAKTHWTSVLAAQEGVQQPKHSTLSAEQAPLPVLLESVNTTVSGEAFTDAAADAPQRQSSTAPNRVPHTGDPLLGMAAPAGILNVAGQALHWHAGETLTLASGQDSDALAMHTARIHSGQAIDMLAAATEGQRQTAALTLVAGEGSLDMQAQRDHIKLQARNNLRIASAHAPLELAAGKAVHLATAGGASITLTGGNITFNAPGTIRVKAQRKRFVGATFLSWEMNTWPTSAFNDKFRVEFPNGEVAQNYRYQLMRVDGGIISGMTDAEGMIPLQQGMSMEGVTIKILEPADQEATP